MLPVVIVYVTALSAMAVGAVSLVLKTRYVEHLARLRYISLNSCH